MKITPYNEIRPYLLTGDQLLCSGQSFVSWLIKRATFSDISHVAKVFVSGDDVFVWESTSLGKGIDGVRMTLMSQWLAEYNGKVYLRHLRYDRDEAFYEAYRTTREDFKNKKYERKILQLIGAALPWRNKADLTDVFCSELTTEVDMRSGVLPRYKPHYLPANEVVPSDYLPGRKIDDRMRWTVKPACFSELIRIK